MKKISIYLLSLMLSGAFLVSCDDDEKTTTKLTFDKNSVEVTVGAEAVVKVSGGETPYKATPADDKVEATVNGSDIKIKGVKEGNTTVKVADKKGVEASVAVVVKPAPAEE